MRAKDAASQLTSQLILQPEAASAVQLKITRDEWTNLWLLATQI